MAVIANSRGDQVQGATALGTSGTLETKAIHFTVTLIVITDSIRLKSCK